MPAECAVCEWHPYPTCEMGVLRTVGDRGATRNGKSRLQRDHGRVDGPLGHWIHRSHYDNATFTGCGACIHTLTWKRTQRCDTSSEPHSFGAHKHTVRAHAHWHAIFAWYLVWPV